MYVAERRLDVAEHRFAREHVLALADDRDDVEELERHVVVGDDVQRRCAHVVRRAVLDRIDRRPVRRRDVDALMEREEARAVERAGEDPVLVDRPRVAEEGANRVLPVERLERPGIRRGGARRGKRQRENREDE